MAEIEVRHLAKHYGTTRALDDVSLRFAEGEIFGLLGPSGSGKTTLLRAIAGFVSPDQGQILFDQQEVAHVPTYLRDIGMVFQNYALFPHMTVAENIAFGLTIQKRHNRADIAAQVKDALALVRLENLGQRKPSTLSGGQQQRVALARALITRPKVLLLDEPLAALDRRLRQEMQIELKAIQRQTGITAIFVTHDQEEALSLSDRIGIIHQGKLIEEGSPLDVYNRPKSLFGAEFLGDANVFADGKRIIRPEKLHMSQDGLFSARIEQMIFSGPSINYLLSCDQFRDQKAMCFVQNAHESPFTQGQIIQLSWSDKDVIEVSS